MSLRTETILEKSASLTLAEGKGLSVANDDLLEKAIDNGAAQDVLELLEAFPDEGSK